MSNDELAAKMIARIDYMLLQYLPAPSCANKRKAHAELIKEIKAKIAAGLSPQNNGININITVK